MATYFITGGNRGIGLELARQLASRAEAEEEDGVGTIFVTTRGAASPSLESLLRRTQASGKVVQLECDVTVPSSLDSALAVLRSHLGETGGVDVLVNNVGAQSAPVQGIEALPDEDLLRLFDVNVLAAHRVSRALLPFLRKGKGKTIVNISTTLGSVGLAKTYGPVPTPAYKITKAALNMLTVQYALGLGKEGFTVLAVSPGNLKTDLGGGDGADLTVEEGVKATLDVILKAKPEQNGQFLNIHVPGWENAGGMNQYDGKEIPW